MSEKVLIVKGKAGLGNRLLSALGSILYAQISRRRLYVDWGDRGYSRDRQNSFPAFFEAPVLADPAEVAAAAARSLAPTIWRDHLSQSVDELMSLHEAHVEADTQASVNAKYTIDFLRADYPEDAVVRWSYTDEMYRLRRHFHGPFAYLREWRDEAILRHIIKDELRRFPPSRSASTTSARTAWAMSTSGCISDIPTEKTHSPNIRFWSIASCASTPPPPSSSPPTIKRWRRSFAIAIRAWR
jgi:hypothetical protein